MIKKPRPFSWMNPKLEVRNTGKYGKGVFVRRGLIKKNEMLFVMGGSILTIADENRLRGVVADKPIEISEYFSIGPRSPAELKRMPDHYVNHSCQPNAGFKGQIFLVAMRAIRAGREVTYDYAMVMHPNVKSTSYFTMKCFCGHPSCRKLISEDDWQIPALQRQYDGYFQWYLQEIINQQNRRRYVQRVRSV
jgi:hypothetical protein